MTSTILQTSNGIHIVAGSFASGYHEVGSKVFVTNEQILNQACRLERDGDIEGAEKLFDRLVRRANLH
jgi:hypothetical protein